MSTAVADNIRVTYNDQSYLVPMRFVMKEHPGGKGILLKYKDGDITKAFTDAEHSDDAMERLEEWVEKATPEQRESLNARAAKRDTELNEWRWRSTAIAFGVATAVTAYLVAIRRQV